MAGDSQGRAFVQLLGPVQVTVGSEINLPSEGKAKLLLALLTLRKHARDEQELIDLLWDQHPTKSATSAFRTYLADVRKTVGETRVVTTARSHRLHPDKVHTDIDIVNADVARAHELLEQNPSAASILLLQALNQWRGKALEGVRDFECLAPDIRILDEHFESIREQYLAARLASGDYATVIPDLRRAVQECPWRERLTALLMTALFESGNRIEALRAYQFLYKYLADEFGMPPSNDLVSLEQSMILETRHASPPQVDARFNLTPGLEAAAQDFVGRRWILDALGQEAGPIKVVLGESGSGKTAIASTLLQTLTQAGLRVAYGKAERDSLAPLFCLAEAFPTLAQQSQNDETLAVEVLLSWASSTASAVLVVDDYQWADPLTKRTLFLLARTNDARRPILRIFCRPGSHSGDFGIRPITIAPMDSHDIEELLLKKGLTPDSSVVEHVGRVSKGRAIYVAAIIDHIAQTGEVPVRSIESTAEVLAPILQLTFSEYLPNERKIYGAIEVCWPKATSERVARVLNVDLTLVEHVVKRGLDEHILIDGETIGFRHELLARHSVGFLDRRVVREIHALLAGDENLHPWERALHGVKRAEGRQTAEELREFESSVLQALNEGQNGAATELLDQILVQFDQQLLPEQRFRFLHFASRAHDLCGDLELGRRRRAAAFDVAESNGLKAEAVKCVVGEREAGRSVKVDAQEMSLLRRAGKLVAGESPDLILRVHSELAYQKLYHRSTDRDDIESDISIIKNLLTSVRDPLARALGHRSLYLASTLGLESGSDSHAESMILALPEVDHVDFKASAFQYGIRQALTTGDRVGLRALSDRFATFATETRRPVDLWCREVIRAAEFELDGNFGRSRHHARTARALGKSFGCPDAELAWGLHILSSSLLTNTAPPTEERVGVSKLIPLLEILLQSQAKTLRHDSSGLTAAVQQAAMGPVNPSTLTQLSILTESVWNIGAVDHAKILLTALTTNFPTEKFVVVGHVPVTVLGPVARLRGMLWCLLRYDEMASIDFSEALKVSIDFRALTWVQRVRRDFALLLEQRGKFDESTLLRSQAEIDDHLLYPLDTSTEEKLRLG